MIKRPRTNRVKSPIPLVNRTSVDIPPFAALEIDGLEVGTGMLKVKRPTSDGATKVVFNLGGFIPKNGGQGAGAINWPVRSLYDPDDGEPETGESWGTRSGSFKLAKGKFGCRAIKGSMLGPSAMFFPETLCRPSDTNRHASGSASSHYTQYYPSWCCGNPLPDRLCANVLGTTAHDGGYVLNYWNGLGAGLPPWWPPLQTLSLGYSYGSWGPSPGSQYIALPSKTCILAAPDGKPLKCAAWWSDLVLDMECPQAWTEHYSGVSGSPPTAYDFYAAYDFQLDFYTALVFDGCFVFMVQIVHNYGGVTITGTGGGPSSSWDTWSISGAEGSVLGYNCLDLTTFVQDCLNLNFSGAFSNATINITTSPFSWDITGPVIADDNYQGHIICACPIPHFTSFPGSENQFSYYEVPCYEQSTNCKPIYGEPDPDCDPELEPCDPPLLGYDDSGPYIEVFACSE